MKKILFITTRDPYSGRYSGDVIRSLKILKLLKKKHSLTLICLKNDIKKLKEKNFIYFKNPNFFFKIFFCLFSLLKLEPIHFGLFFSKEMKSYLDNHANDFDCLFFYHIRSSQYLPRNYYGETIIELGDLYSENYLQTFKKLNFLNPLKYIYYFESLLVKKMEKKILSKFDKIILFSKNEVKKIDTNFKQKIFQIEESVDKVRNFFSYSKKNFRILFVGNLNYLPNFLACKKFVKEIFPTLQKKIPNLKFCIIGDISKFRKKLFSSYSNVEVLGLKKNLSNYIKTSFCGLANMEIATGIQGKVLTYMSHGLPVICSDKVSENFGSTVLKYKDNSELIRKIIFLKNNKSQSNQFSKKSLKFIKKQIWKRISKHYLKLINF